MEDLKHPMIKSPFGSVFTTFNEEKWNEISDGSERQIAVSGKVNNPGIFEISDDTTLQELIDMAGGILNNKNLKLLMLAFHVDASMGKMD